MATSGAIITDFGSYDLGKYVFQQTDGKIVVLGLTSGLSSDDLAIARYNANGSLDTTFSGDGKLVATATMTINSVKLLSDGKFLTVGASGGDFAVTRYNANGSLDTTFDTDGKVTTNVGYTNDAAYNVTVQADGKLVVAGFDSDYTAFAVARYNPDGSLDTIFAGDGIMNGYNNSLRYSGAATAVAVQPDGKVVAAGNYYNDFGIMRLDRYGNLDTSFDGDGKASTDLGGIEVVNAVTLLSSGKILVAGKSDANFALVRYNPNGTLDTTFDTDGIVITALGTTGTLNDLVATSDGKFIAVGTDGNNDIILMRFNSNGSFDTNFSTDGKVTTDLGGWEEGKSVTLQSDGKILVAGSSDTNFALVRYNANGSLDTTFNGSNTTNHAPTGTVTINDTTPAQGQTLTAANTLADADGLGAITYKWKTGTTLLGTGANYTVTAADVGKALTVTASYTDDLGKAETKTSAVTAAVTATSTGGTGTAGVAIVGTDFSTSEQGNTAVFNIKLNSAPTRDVTINLTSSDTTEGVLSKSAFTFTAANWSTAQTLTVTGKNDSLSDGNIAYTVNATVSTLDVIYKSVSVNSLTLTNQDTPVASTETINGTDNIDVLQGTAAPSYMLGKAGDDDLSGGAGNDTLYGSYGDDVLFGEDGNDKLYGEQDSDYLNGGAGNDILDGGLGVDTLIGGAGNDTYYLGYDATDIIKDNGLATDVDTVIMPYQLTNYTLAAGIENATISAGTQAANLTGNAGSNTLKGNDGSNVLKGGAGADKLIAASGADVLIGGDGNDTLTGGVGKDIFKFLVKVGVDKITDFKPVDDTVQLENSVFTKLAATGVLNAANFKIGAAAADTNDYLVYNSGTGAVLYDADGNGAGAAVQIAVIGANLSLTSADFVVI